MFSGNTIDTTRIWGENTTRVMLNAFQMVYPGLSLTNVKWKPKALIMAPIDSFPFAFTASSLVHDPNNAPLMLVPEQLTDELCNEVVRLNLSGIKHFGHVLLVGPVNNLIEHQLQQLGLKIYRVGSGNPYETAETVSRFRLSNLPEGSQGRKNYFIVSGETYAESLFVPNYCMHQGLPLLFVKKDEIPRETQRFMTLHKDMNVYIVGSEKTISSNVQKQISSQVIGKVERISGENPYELAVQFARYYDPTSNVGWNRNQKGKGDAFSFVEVTNWRQAIISGLFSHVGKHAPLLLTAPNKLHSVVQNYLHHLKPEFTMPPQPPFMHGFVLGDFDLIHYETQIEIEESIMVGHE